MCPATMLREVLHVSIPCTVDTGGMSDDLHPSTCGLDEAIA